MIQQLTDLIQAEAQFRGHSLDSLEHGLIPFATMKQVRKIIILLRECNVPEEWRLWVTGQLVGRQLRSSKDLSMAEAGAIIEAILVGPDGKGDSETEPCEFAVEAIGQMLKNIVDHAFARKLERVQGRGLRVEVITQSGFC